MAGKTEDDDEAENEDVAHGIVDEAAAETEEERIDLENDLA